MGWEWDDQSRPAIILIHGFRGHAHWWSFLAPFFLDTYRIAAIDLSGMGDSDHRDSYGPFRFAEDILAFIDHFSLTAPTLIGHSFGGSQVLKVCAQAPERIGHAIIVDTYVNFPDSDQLPVIAPLLQTKKHPSREQAIDRFRLDPPQPEVSDILLHHIAYHSVRHSHAGWHWKFDPALTNFEEKNGPALLENVQTKIDYVYGERSIVAGNGRAQRIFQLLPNANQLVKLDNAYHHLMLDHPLELVDTLQKLLQAVRE
ncbi:alpha/beta hydrolase [Pseudomaricurvus hydrocarbonicus]